jgi:hypothetical protein
MKVKVAIGALVTALALGFAYDLRPCACVTGVQVSRVRLDRELHKVAEAQEHFLASHRRYALRLRDLDYSPDSTIVVRLVPAHDSSLLLLATSKQMPEVSCSLRLRARFPPAEQVECRH